jgi:hypothetical protein
MYVDVEIVTATRTDALLLSKRSLVYDGDQLYVYRLLPERKVERVLVEPRLADRCTSSRPPVSTKATSSSWRVRRGSRTRPRPIARRSRSRGERSGRQRRQPQRGQVMQPAAPSSHFTTSRPVAVLMVFLAAVVFGFSPSTAAGDADAGAELPDADGADGVSGGGAGGGRERDQPADRGGPRRDWRAEQDQQHQPAGAQRRGARVSSGARTCPRRPRKPSRNWTWSSCRARPSAR